MTNRNLELVRGTLDLLILKTLSWGPRHGYGVANCIEILTGEALTIEEGSLYPALHRLEGRGWVEGEWGLSENNRRAKYYRLTRDGRRALEVESKAWARFTDAVALVLGATRAPRPASPS